ncbi:MAG: PBP1A family penicillin-binding protein, partial [Candidatus Eremiobacteraeota bacterium]|nr:PBP1A family penicillin-binding protein [Candidatus Eremiobacteraeota bacterium]
GSAFFTGVVSAGLLAQDLPDADYLYSYKPGETSKIYASDGTWLGTLYKENREWVDLEKVPNVVQEAILAIEDSRFYFHRGVDWKGIIRALKADLEGKKITQGASTITQQLARNIFLTPRKTFKRKIKEILLAFEIEKRLSKREILELYINQIYFGSGAYGIQAAARTYFNKDVSKLTLPEAALLAGLPAAPSIYSPYENPKLAKRRQVLVLNRMVEVGFISRKKANEAAREKLEFKSRKTQFQTLTYPYFTTYVLHDLLSRNYDEDLLYRGGLDIYTTMNPRLQRLAEKAVKWGVNEGKKIGLGCSQAALVSLEPDTGYIRAMAGGVEFSIDDQFNRAWQAKRQPGSSFKVFVYTTALLQGYLPDSPVEDSPVSYPQVSGKTWTPKNCDNKFWGKITFRRALQFSRNVCAIKVLDRLTPESVIKTAYNMGITSPMEPNLSLALGSSVLTPLEMASAFGVIANSGIRVEPVCIKLIKDPSGRIIEDNRHPKKHEVLPHVVAHMMVGMLKDVINAGTGTRAKLDRPAAGKTGTSDKYRDAWFIGFTPQYVTAVWLGNDDFSEMDRAYGGDIPAMTWKYYMSRAHKGLEKKDFEKPKFELVRVRICNDSGKRATSKCPNVTIRLMKASEVPKEFCPLHPEKEEEEKKEDTEIIEVETTGTSPDEKQPEQVQEPGIIKLEDTLIEETVKEKEPAPEETFEPEPEIPQTLKLEMEVKQEHESTPPAEESRPESPRIIPESGEREGSGN